jgi:hypothetical protein
VASRAVESLALGPVLAPRARARLERLARLGPDVAFLPVELPLAVGEAVGAEPWVAHASAAVGALVWAGADLLDDVADGDVEPGVSASLDTLVACNLMQGAAQRVLAQLAPRVGADRAIDAMERLACTLAEMSRGQADDLTTLSGVGAAGRDDPGAVARYDEVVARKAGAELAFFAWLPARLAGAPPAACDAWLQFGRSMGCLVQVRSDLSGALTSPYADLLAGKRTQPVLVGRFVVDEVARAGLDQDLDRAARGDRAAAARAAGVLSSAEGLFGSYVKMELHRYRAAAALGDLPRTAAIERVLAVHPESKVEVVHE